MDNSHVTWLRVRSSGTIVFNAPTADDQGYYQCFVVNIFGTAVSNRVHVRLGVLDHFQRRPLRTIQVDEGDALTVTCAPPYGKPTPTVFWLNRNEQKREVIETINREHITADAHGSLHFSYVGQHDAREHLIYQCAATSPVLHGEYRAGDQVRLVVNKSKLGLLNRPVKLLWATNASMEVMAGTKMKLTCIFSGL